MRLRCSDTHRAYKKRARIEIHLYLSYKVVSISHTYMDCKLPTKILSILRYVSHYTFSISSYCHFCRFSRMLRRFFELNPLPFDFRNKFLLRKEIHFAFRRIHFRISTLTISVITCLFDLPGTFARSIRLPSYSMTR